MNKSKNLLVKASIGYLGLHALGWMLSSLVGGFLLLTAIATLGFLFPFACVDWYVFGAGFDGESHVGTVWAASAICGSVCALCTISRIARSARRGRR